MKETLRLLRSAATLFVFGVFSFGAVFLGVPVFFLLTVLIRNRRSRCLMLRRLVRMGFRFIVFLAGMLYVFRVHFVSSDSEGNGLHEVSGSSLFADVSDGHRVIIANHPTLADYLILTSVLNVNVNSMVKNSLTRGFMKHIISHLGYVNNQSSFEEVAAAAQSGDNLLIFPEGGRTRGEISFKRGAANMASRLNMDVVPVLIYCSEPDYLSSGFLKIRAPEHVPHFYFRRASSVSVSEVVPDTSLPPAVRARHLNHYLEDFYRAETAAFAKTCRASRNPH